MSRPATVYPMLSGTIRSVMRSGENQLMRIIQIATQTIPYRKYESRDCFLFTGERVFHAEMSQNA